MQQNKQQREELERNQPLPPLSPTFEEVTPGPCFTLHTITFDGAEHLSRNHQRQLTRDFIGQCLSLAQINQLIKNVSNEYIQQGYITSRAFLTEQDLSQGRLNIVVLEGKLEAITLEGESPLSLTMAFSHLQGKILNLRDIEQGMEQINRVRNEPVQIEILPGNQAGYSIVELHAAAEFPLRLSVGWSNRGRKSTGTEQLNASLTANNLFGLAERGWINSSRSSAFTQSHDVRALQTGVSIPYGYGLTDYNYSIEKYSNVVNSRGYHWLSHGQTQAHRVTGNWTLYRNGKMKTAILLGLTRRKVEDYFENQLVRSSSHISTSTTLGINHGQRMGDGFITFNPGFHRGIPYFGCGDHSQKGGDLPKASFTKWTLATSYYLPVTTHLVYLTSITGQWTPGRLYGVERLTLGGESSVRGFKEQYLSGDKGGYWRNELEWRLFSRPGIGPVNLIAALDGGFLQYDSHDPHDSGSLWGAAVGIGSSGPAISSQLTIGCPLSHPRWLNPDRVAVYYRIGLAF